MEKSVALVTGANKGIGKEIARQLAAEGVAVWVGSRDAARGERAAEDIGGDARLLDALAPGLRRTDLNATAATSDGDPAEAAASAVRLALLPDDGPTGEFFSWDGTTVPW